APRSTLFPTRRSSDLDPDIFIDQLLEEGRQTGHIRLQTSLESRKDYLYIDDAVRALIDISTSPARGIINVASGQAVSNREIMERSEEHTSELQSRENL